MNPSLQRVISGLKLPEKSGPRKPATLSVMLIDGKFWLLSGLAVCFVLGDAETIKH